MFHLLRQYHKEMSSVSVNTDWMSAIKSFILPEQSSKYIFEIVIKLKYSRNSNWSNVETI